MTTDDRRQYLYPAC